MLQVNDRVKAILPCDGKSSVQYERGQIIYIGRRALVRFDSHVCGHSGNGLGEDGYHWLMNLEYLEKEN
jgi:hypothetical protein